LTEHLFTYILKDVSTLYIVGTPIGNLGDITFRALETFKAVDVIAAEDTRHTLELLTHFEIRKPLISCRSQNEQFASEKIIGLLNEGQTVAYASDAGTPGISDPGAVLAGLARQAGHTVVPIPGASAFATLASVAGAGGKTLIFEGFLSPKPGRRRARLRELMATGDAIIIYESPFRIVKLLTDIADIESDRRVVVGRELTKLHEEINDDTAAAVRDDYAARAKIQGEFAVFISGTKNAKLSEEDSDNC
jgi:16S rRNA (cytidine1402-2'-O)-methyltransferase